jgi:hypothetical protein
MQFAMPQPCSRLGHCIFACNLRCPSLVLGWGIAALAEEVPMSSHVKLLWLEVLPDLAIVSIHSASRPVAESASSPLA